MVLQHEFNTCPPGCNLWEKLRQAETRLREKPDFRSDCTHLAEVRAEITSMVMPH